MADGESFMHSISKSLTGLFEVIGDQREGFIFPDKITVKVDPFTKRVVKSSGAFIVVVHSLVSLLFVWDDERQKTFDRLSFFINVIFFLIVVSFISATLGIWKIIDGTTAWNLYKTYFIIAFAALHVDILSKAMGREKYMDIVIYVNYVFTAIVVLMLQPIIYVDNALQVLGGMFYRFLGAAGLVDGTLSILTIIFYKLYLSKHPSAENKLAENPKEGKKGLSIWVWILIIYLCFQIGAPLLFWLSFASSSIFRK